MPAIQIKARRGPTYGKGSLHIFLADEDGDEVGGPIIINISEALQFEAQLKESLDFLNGLPSIEMFRVEIE